MLERRCRQVVIMSQPWFQPNNKKYLNKKKNNSRNLERPRCTFSAVAAFCPFDLCLSLFLLSGEEIMRKIRILKTLLSIYDYAGEHFLSLIIQCKELLILNENEFLLQAMSLKDTES